MLVITETEPPLPHPSQLVALPIGRPETSPLRFGIELW